MDIDKITTNLELREDHIWFSKGDAPVSYPEKGNNWCWEIEQNSFWFKHRNRCILTALHLFPPQGTLFDVGGGNGFVSQAIKNAGMDVVLVEPGVQGARNARSRDLQPIICSTLEDAGFKEQSIPAIGLFDVLEHIQDDTQFLKHIEQRLIIGGRLYITVPAYNFLWSAEDDYAGHYRRYTIKTLANKLKSAGFEIDFIAYIFFVLPIPVFFFRTLPDRLKLRNAINLNQELQEHRPRKGVFGGILDWVLEQEIHALKRKMKIPFGGSCLAVVRRSQIDRSYALETPRL